MAYVCPHCFETRPTVKAMRAHYAVWHENKVANPDDEPVIEDEDDEDSSDVPDL